MSDHKESDQDHYNENLLYGTEEQSRQDWDNEQNNIEEISSQDNDPIAQKLWLSFQTSATSTAQLYKDGLSCANPENLWIPFKKAAAAVTVLYTDSMAAKQRAFEQGQLAGQRKRTREVISWMKKRGRRNIRRDELMNFLLGHPLLPGHALRHSVSDTSSLSPLRMAAGNNVANCGGGAPGTLVSARSPQGHHSPNRSNDHHELQPFHDALVLQEIDGAMSSVSVRNNYPSKNAEMDRTILDNIGRQIREGKRQRDASSESPTRNKRGRYY